MSPISIAALIQALMAVSEIQNDDMANYRPDAIGDDDSDDFDGASDAADASGIPEQD